jgi:putative thiamine transport system ATP-binding protein
MLTVQQLTLRLNGRALFAPLNLRVAPGEILTLMGPSGAGKSSVLHWLVGALDPAFVATGSVQLGGRCLDTLPTELRHLGLLFQDDLLFAHLSVGGNLALALPPSVRGAAARKARVQQALVHMGLDGFHDRDPASLSGGQRARVSLMRTLLAEPQAVLLDEPFSRLDADLRAQFRAWVFQHLTDRAIPTLLVTHDAADVPMGGQILHLKPVRHD